MIGKFEETKAFDYENGFYLTSEPYRLGNILAHYELYKMIVNLPGDLVELGVFKGSSLIQFATFRELLENEKARKIIGFDMFGEFPTGGKVSSDNIFAQQWNDSFKGAFLSRDDIYNSLEYKGIHNVELVKGDITETLDTYLEDNPHLKISFLHIDTDVYEPAKVALERLYDRVVRGGVIVFDDYGTIEGETLAVDEFFKDKPFPIKKFTFSHTKPAYIIKE